MEKKEKRTRFLTTVVLILGMTVLLMCSLAGCTGTDVSETDGQSPETAMEEKPDDSSGQGTEPADRSGAVVGTKQVVDAQFDAAYPYSEGFAVVGKDTGSGMKYNYIDLDGNYLLQEWVDAAYSFSEGMACVGTMMEPEVEDYYSEQLYLFGYVDTTGQMAIKAEYVGSDYYHPLCFYEGYAEVQYYRIINEGSFNYYRTDCNVIDRQGNRLFDFDAELYDEYGYGGWGPDYRLLSLNWQGLGWSDYYYYNRWMSNYVNHTERNSVLEDVTTGTCYLVSPDGSILNTTPGSAFEIGDGLYSISHYNEDGTESIGLYDAQWNLIREGWYYELNSDWFEEIITVTDETGGTSYSYRIWDKDFQPVTEETYREINPIYENGETIGYIAWDEQMVWKYLDKDLNEVFIFEGEYDYIQKLTNSYTSDDDFAVTLYSGRNYDNSITALLDEQGRILRSTTGTVSYRLANSEVLLEYTYGQSMILVDHAGNDLLVISLVDFNDISNDIRSTEDTIQIYGYMDPPEDMWGRIYYSMDIVKTNGQWEMQGMQEITVDDYYHQTALDEEVLLENDESRVWGVFLYGYTEEAGPVRLEDVSGKVLEPAQTALSLVEDNLYLVAGKIQPIEGSWWDDYEAVEMYLQNTEQTLNIEVFEKLGLLSEDRIAFRENGKWGYLELVREAP